MGSTGSFLIPVSPLTGPWLILLKILLIVLRWVGKAESRLWSHGSTGLYVILAPGGRRSRVQAILSKFRTSQEHETLSQKHEDRRGRACLRNSVPERLCQKDHFEGILSYITPSHL